MLLGDLLLFHLDGIVFYRSKNNVILSSGIDGFIDPKYFEKVIDKEGHNLLLSE